MMDVKFRIPEVWTDRDPDDVINNLLTQIEDEGLGDYVMGIQQYKHSIEVLVDPHAVGRFLEVQINVEGCGFYFIANDEPVLFVNVRGMKLSADWKEVVRVMSKYGRPVNYYEAKRMWRGREIRNGVRVVWIKCVDKDKIPEEWKKWEIPGNMIAPSKSGSSDDDSSFMYDFERTNNNFERTNHVFEPKNYEFERANNNCERTNYVFEPKTYGYERTNSYEFERATNSHEAGYTLERTSHHIQSSRAVRRASQTSSTRLSVLRNCLWVLDQKEEE